MPTRLALLLLLAGGALVLLFVGAFGTILAELSGNLVVEAMATLFFVAALLAFAGLLTTITRLDERLTELERRQQEEDRRRAWLARLDELEAELDGPEIVVPKIELTEVRLCK